MKSLFSYIFNENSFIDEFFIFIWIQCTIVSQLFSYMKFSKGNRNVINGES